MVEFCKTTCKLNKLAHFTMTVKVKGIPELRTRLAVGKFLLKAAAWCMGCFVKIEFSNP